MKIALQSIAIVAGTALAVTSAQGVTIATFADPAAGPSTPLFAFNSGTGVLTGQWLSAPNLLLQVPGASVGPASYANAQFQMTPIATVGSIGPILVMGAGQVNYFDASNVPLMTISFSGGYLNPATNFGASDFTGFNVTFTGPILAGLTLSNEAFSFSFANPATATPTGSYTVTSSFSSSADVPAPASFALLGLGGLVAARRRR